MATKPRRIGAVYVNAKPVKENLAKLIGGSPGIMEIALREVGKDIKRKAKELVPVKTGALKKGISYAVQPSKNVARVFASAKAGGAPREYALIVHEDLEANHPSGGQAKFISQPIQEVAADGELLRTLAEAARKRFREKFGFMPDMPAEVE